MYLELNNYLQDKKFISNDNFIKDIKIFLNNSKSNNINHTTFYSIDRFVGNFAICENQTTGEFINIPKVLIPKQSKETDILKFENNKFTIDKNQTEIKKEEIKDLATSLFKRRSSN